MTWWVWVLIGAALAVAWLIFAIVISVPVGKFLGGLDEKDREGG